MDGEYFKAPNHAWTWIERIWAGEIARMLLTEKIVWENTEQEPVVCNAINLIYELRALILCTDWQHCEVSPTFLCECAKQLTCFDCGSVSFPELIWWRVERKYESGVKFLCTQTSTENYIFYSFFATVFASRLQLSHMGISSRPHSPWKE